MSAPARWLQQFADGFLKPSRLSALVAAIYVVASLAFVVWFYSVPVLSGPLGRFLAKSGPDADAWATWRVLQLRRDPPDRPELLVVGSSMIANGLASEPGLRKAIARDAGRPWSVSILTTPAQSVLEQVALIDAALGPPPGPRHPVVIALELDLLREDATVARTLQLEGLGRLGVRSEWADEEVRRLGGVPPPRSRFYPLDNYRFFLMHSDKSLLRLLTGRPASPLIAAYGPTEPLPPGERERPKILKELMKPHLARPLVFEVFDRLLLRLRPYPQVHVVFFGTRISPQFIAATGAGPMEAAAAARARGYAAAHATELWPVFVQARVSPGAYWDDLHIETEPDRARVREAMAQDLARYAKRQGIR